MRPCLVAHRREVADLGERRRGEVLHGLDEERVDAAGEQALDLRDVGVAQGGEVDVAE